MLRIRGLMAAGVAAVLAVAAGPLWCRAAGLYATPWTNSSMPGANNKFAVSLYTVHSLDPAQLPSFVSVLQATGLANAFDPFYAPSSSVQGAYNYVKTLGWPMLAYNGVPIAGLSSAEQQVLATLDKPGGKACVGWGEWDYTFHDAQAGTYHGYDVNHVPQTKQQAYDYLKAYFQGVSAANGNRVWSVTGHSNYEAYAADWGSNGIGLEIGEGIRFTQTKFAFARGASRQSGLPWSVQVSPWFGGYMTTAANPDYGHSLSFYKRTWLHSWFAGAAMLTPEAGINYLFTSIQSPWPVSPYGAVAAQHFNFMKNHDRGVAYTPMVIMLDKCSGYNGFETTSWVNNGNPAPWGLPELGTANDRKVYDLFDKQLFPGDDAWVYNEHDQLVNTPYGEMFDVLLTSTTAQALGKYQKILLAGDITFDEGVISKLETALRSGSQLMLKQEHINAMGSAFYSRLRNAGAVEVLADWTNPATGRGTYISNARLAQLSNQYLPVRVAGDVEYQVNKNAKGWLLELVNNDGVTKDGASAAIIDANETHTVTVTPAVDFLGAELWRVGYADQSLPWQSSYRFTIGPGETMFVQFITVPEPSTLVLMGIGSLGLLAYAWRERK